MRELIVSDETKALRDSLGKLSVVKYAEKRNTPLHSNQVEIATMFEDPNIHKWWYFSVLCSRRFGKSYFAKNLAETFMLLPYQKIGIVTHSSDLSERYFSDVLASLQQIPNLEVEWSKQRGWIKIPSLNTTLTIASENTWEARFVGASLSLLILDEFALFDVTKGSLLMDKLLPTGSQFGSTPDGIPYMKVISLTTPRGHMLNTEQGRRHFQALNGEKGYIFAKYTIYDSPFLTDEEIEVIKENTTHENFMQEYMCEYMSAHTLVYRNFKKDKHIIKPNKDFIKSAIEDCTLIWAVDTGFTDGNGATFLIYHNKSKKHYIIGEEYNRGMTSEEHIDICHGHLEAIIKEYKINPRNIVGFYDPSNPSVAKTANRKYGYTMFKALNKRDEGFDYVNTLYSGVGTSGDPMLYIWDTCEETIRQTQYAEFKQIGGNISNQYQKDTRGTHYELCDTVRYAVYSNKKYSNNVIIIT